MGVVGSTSTFQQTIIWTENYGDMCYGKFPFIVLESGQSQTNYDKTVLCRATVDDSYLNLATLITKATITW